MDVLRVFYVKVEGMIIEVQISQLSPLKILLLIHCNVIPLNLRFGT